MARAIYSHRLWGVASTASGGTVLAPSVPAGFVWDLRDIVAINGTNLKGSFVSPLKMIVNSSLTVFETPAYASITNKAYHWEGRQIVTDLDVLVATSLAAAWSWVISGYALTV